MKDLRLCKLGKRAPRKDERHLEFAKYVKSTPPAPSSLDLTKGQKTWGMMLNDQLGDCTCAAVGHAIQVWSLNANGTEVTLPDQAILQAYEQVSGYDPNTGANDNGAVETDVLNLWRQQGIAGHAISAYVAINPKNLDHVRLAAYLFGGVYIGIALPLLAQQQLQQGQVWDAPRFRRWGNAASGSWGGHAVFTPMYDGSSLTCITWGGLQQMTNLFWNRYVDEVYAVLSPDWMVNNESPAGFDLQTLMSDLQAVAA